jgi:uncharacterized protein (TIGR01777 family)
VPKLSFSSTYPVSREELFAWHEKTGALARLTPPWSNVEVESFEGMRDGDRAVLKLSKGPFSKRWVAVHTEFAQGKQFADYQESGPFSYWYHVHRFEPFGVGESKLIDEIEFELPLGAIGEKFGTGFAKKEIERAFNYRHRILGQDILLHKHYNLSRVALKVGITGSSGLIGSELAAFLSTGGHKVRRIVRERTGNTDDIFWNPETGEIDRAGLEGLDAVIHLAGENVIKGRWDSARKNRIKESRVRGTSLLARTLATLDEPPSVFLSASGIDIYGSNQTLAVTEASALRPGGFLSSVAKEWEAAAGPAFKAGIRTVFLRLGAVLSPRGGVLRRILPYFYSGLGGSLSGEEQWISWVSMDDVLGSIYHTMMSTTAGPVNIVVPQPVTVEIFSGTLANVVRRPAFIRLPASVARPLFGEVADEILLESVRAHPEYLTSSGYRFLYPRLEDALRHMLGRKPPRKLDLSVLSS